MQPAHHEQALVAFYLRHALLAPAIDTASLIERHGLVLAMGFALRESGFNIRVGYTHCTIGGESFTRDEVAAAGAEAHMLAHRVEGIIDGAVVEADGSCIDAMAMAMRRMEQADIAVTPRALIDEGFPAAVVEQHGLEAAQLAEAIKVGIRSWRKASAGRARATDVREAA